MKWYVLLIDSSRLYFSLSDENISPYEPSVSLFPPLPSFPDDCGFELHWREVYMFHWNEVGTQY